ncbi:MULTISPECIES: DUF4870 family protein [Methylotuvimicrobium]|uniref:Membrane protein-like protein n=2 Tax=Methylotuvimicrobium TaxID=2822410 RepID=G4T2E2_META2|nr:MULTISPECIES: membrane protein [Methylotuvimicrobium]QCW82784.1 hypothetical protein EQU24_11435 [Methylotuvimicrobium buryatense]CCE23582.1 Membrane protein-like protein [Methylotuvimicrobium alcaliphilum 20Z]
MNSNETDNNKINAEKMEKLKNLTGIVYLCQVLAFGFAGLPIFIGVAINFIKRNDVRGTWLESHFDWQIKTAWVAVALLAASGLTFAMGLGWFLLIFAVLWLVYRIALGWHTLFDNKPMVPKNFK